MTIVIIAGGSGTRLWPLSTPEYPKHLLQIGGNGESILEQTYQRAKRLTSDIYIVSEQSHAHELITQLPEIDSDHFFVEPSRRGTANCMLAALFKLSSRIAEDEPIAFIHADHFIRDTAGFVHTFKMAMDISNKEQRIVLIGVEPSYPATGFGYIGKGDLYDSERFIYEVNSFKEKPDFNIAQGYLVSGNFLWNCGYFVGSQRVFRTKIEQYAPNLFKRLNKLAEAGVGKFDEIYLGFETEAVDNALIEKVQDLLVVPASFDWMDLGSYADLSNAVESDESGNYLKGKVEIDEVHHSYIENHEEKPLAVIGLDNCVVVNTKSGILVTRKDMSQQVGDMAKKITEKETQ